MQQNKYKHLPNTGDIDTEISTFTHLIQKAYRDSTKTIPEHNTNPVPDPFLLDLIKQRNKMRRNYQKTGNQTFKLYRNLLTTKIQKEITNAKIRS